MDQATNFTTTSNSTTSPPLEDHSHNHNHSHKTRRFRSGPDSGCVASNCNNNSNNNSNTFTMGARRPSWRSLNNKNNNKRKIWHYTVHYMTLVVCMAIWFHLVYYSSDAVTSSTSSTSSSQPSSCRHASLPISLRRGKERERYFSSSAERMLLDDSTMSSPPPYSYSVSDSSTSDSSTSDSSTSDTADGPHLVPCFLTVQMGANGDFPEPLQNMTDLGIRLPGYRYIVMTNDGERLDGKDWEKVVVNLDTTRFTRVKTHVTYAKFLAWRHPALATCRVVFVMDALNVPVNNATLWEQMEQRMRTSPGHLLALLKPNNVTNLDHTLRLPMLKKETKQMAQLTHDWLASRNDYDRNTTLCIWTNFFAYDPANQLYRAASADFWHHYSMEMLTARDQPLWSYFVAKWTLQPHYLRLFDNNNTNNNTGDDPNSSRERRPHVHVCAERSRLLCEQDQQRAAASSRKLTGGLPGLTGSLAGDDNNVEMSRSSRPMDCEAITMGGRYQYPLINVTDPMRINCDKKPGGHIMSVLTRF